MSIRGTRRTGRRIVLMAAALPLAAGGFFAATAATAQAAANPKSTSVVNDCHLEGSLCFWVDAGFTGEKGHISGNNGNWGTLSGGSTCPNGTWNNCISSAYDQQGEAVRLWETVGDKDGLFCIANDTGYRDFSTLTFSNGDRLNDAVSANFFQTTTTCH